MNENAKKWVTALRSGEYKQAQGTLRRKDAFCCLGVACDLYAKEYDYDWEEVASFSGTYMFFGYESFLPFEVRDWLGLSENLEGYSSNIDALSNRNDEGYRFDEIADLIEEEPEGLFNER